jgi:hypothetical protein
MKYHKIYLRNIFEYIDLLFQNTEASLKFTDLRIDIKLNFNTYSIQVLGLVSNIAVVLRSRTGLGLNVIRAPPS